MIPQIEEVKGKFPENVTLSQATVTLNDMGDKTISTQIKIDGNIEPDFSYDWEIKFQGETYIHPLREPQASKSNESICSVIDLVFYHKTIYDLKRYFFAKMAEIESGAPSVDKYIDDINVNLGDFCIALQNVLDYYFKDENRIEVSLNPDWPYAEEPQYVQIRYTHIWDVLQKVYELFGVRWSVKNNVIEIGYSTEEVAHTFEYGFEGGLLKVERQVQSADIRNSLLGRGGSKNLPYLYFKDFSKYGETDDNGEFTPDPDAIPELRSIYFTELRGKTFRDYVQGWKTNPNRDLSYDDVVEEYDAVRAVDDYAYKAGHEDTTFNPIEYVKDDESIAKYGLLQGGLDNQEDTYPSIQDVEVDGLGRIDEIVGAEEVLVDESITNEIENPNTRIIIDEWRTFENFQIDNESATLELTSDKFMIPKGSVGAFMYIPQSFASIKLLRTKSYSGAIEGSNQQYVTETLDCELISVEVLDNNGIYLSDVSNLPSDVYLQVIAKFKVSGFPKDQSEYVNNPLAGVNGYTINTTYAKVGDLGVNLHWAVDCISITGKVLGNYINPTTRKFGTVKINKNEKSKVTIESDTFEVPEDGATNVDVPINIIVGDSGKGLYEFEKTIKAVNVDTNEVVSSINIPQGKYYLRVEVNIRNKSTSTQTYKVELLPSYVYFPTDSEEFKPTFDIYVKNIWGSTRNDGESNVAYTNRIWAPILGDREGNEAKVVFTTGWLKGHSDYEFTIKEIAYAGDKGVQSEDGIPAEWCLTLYKSDAEMEATGKWIPSTTQQANKGDKFFFIGIDMPHQYVLWAEKKVDDYKRDQLLETAHIKPTWVVETDKVRLNQLQDGESELLLNSLKVGNSISLKDKRFIGEGKQEKLYIQSVTYTWQEGTNIVPDVEVVLSDKVATVTNPVAQIQGEVDALTKQVGSISNIHQVVRVLGDKLYLRKDGEEDESSSPTTFRQLVSSFGYRQGAIGGNGWGLRSEQGKGIFEVDKLIVREEMQVNNLVANQISARGGKEILSAASIECSKVETTEQGFKCYFDQKRGSIANLFVVGDIAYSEVFNPNDITVKFYKREVIEVGNNYILLSLDGKGDGAPQVGDTIVQYGNTQDPHRQFVIIRDVIRGGYERMLAGLDGVNADGVEYYFAGRFEGSRPRWFVGDKQRDYAEWDGETFNIRGKLAVGSGVGGATVVEGGLVTAETVALGSGTINAGITGKGEGDDAIRFWAGETEDKKENAPFRVYDDGTTVVDGKGTFIDIVVKGSIRKPFGKLMDDATIETRDNYTYQGIGSQPQIPWDINQSGRRLTLVGSMTLSAPSQNPLQNFYEDGDVKRELVIDHELVELLGYADLGVFYGWIVLNRKPFRIAQ